mgnify:CR=1 FL=1
MNYNLLNGGLVLKAGNRFFVSNIKTLLTNVDYKSMFWFMNHDGNEIFYTDERRDNHLYKWNIQQQSAGLVINKPCYGVILHLDTLFYIDENDGRLYCCPKHGNRASKIVDEEINCFIIEDDRIYYSTSSHIKRCTLTGSNTEILCDAAASAMILINDILAFADKNNHYILTLLDINTLNRITISEISVSYMNTDGQFLYCINSNSNNNIFRINPKTCKAIRMLNEQASHLHIIEDEIYFCIHKEWHKMSIFGGEAVKIEV